jgi:molybdenum cofactor guanylyltransferase
MGSDKALMRFQGVALVELALAKLRSICSEVAILGGGPELARFGEVLPDRSTGRGPLGGIETALYHASNEWVLLLAVDVPLVPVELLRTWAGSVIKDEGAAPAACFFRVEGRAQPLVSLLRRELAPHVTEALDGGERKVMLVLEEVAAKAAAEGTRPGGLRVDELEDALLRSRWSPTGLQAAMEPLWFANVNTSEEFERVEAQVVEAKRNMFRGRMHLNERGDSEDGGA